jgi:hypothetical protein
VSAAGFDRGLPSFFVAERRQIRLREGYLKYLLLDSAASIERGMNGDSLLVKIHFFVGESGSFRNLDLSCSRFFASSDDVGAASIRVFEGVFRLVIRV